MRLHRAAKCANLAAMLKEEAIRRLGGSPSAVARAVGISTAAVSQWPETLPPRIADRVIAALARAEGKKPRRVRSPAEREVNK